eukprot:tig00021070_g17822.t1
MAPALLTSGSFHAIDAAWFAQHKDLCLLQRVAEHAAADDKAVAIACGASGRDWTFADVLRHAAHVARELGALQLTEGATDDAPEPRVAFLYGLSFDYVAVQFGIWHAGCVAVPLCDSHPAPELEYYIADSGAKVVLCEPRFGALLRPVCAKLGVPLRELEPRSLDPAPEAGRPPALGASRRALVIYTSGTTGRPKGAVHRHGGLRAMAACLAGGWQLSPRDRTLHSLPLHHIHGIVASLNASLWAGAAVEMVPRFSPAAVWGAISRPAAAAPPTHVPAGYAKLVEAHAAMPPAEAAACAAAAARLRLFVSGSAAMAQPLAERWRSISGHDILERWGMTEVGLAISNPLNGPRTPGAVGRPLPGYEVRLVRGGAGEGEGGNAGGHGEEVECGEEGEPGEIRVRGPQVFGEYWGRPAETAAAFDSQGFFKTGDTGIVEGGLVRILGRTSVDIIKSAGYKISALEVERVLLAHPSVLECAVIGRDDAVYGQTVAAVVVWRPGAAVPSLEEVRAFCRGELAPYKCPREVLAAGELPRNAMGKVNKTELARLFE